MSKKRRGKGDGPFGGDATIQPQNRNRENSDLIDVRTMEEEDGRVLFHSGDLEHRRALLSESRSQLNALKTEFQKKCRWTAITLRLVIKDDEVVDSVFDAATDIQRHNRIMALLERAGAMLPLLPSSCWPANAIRHEIMRLDLHLRWPVFVLAALSRFYGSADQIPITDIVQASVTVIDILIAGVAAAHARIPAMRETPTADVIIPAPSPTAPEASNAASTTQGSKRIWLAHALLLVLEHPDWSDANIAKTVGRNKSTLSRSPEYQAAAKLARGDSSDRHKGYIRRDPTTGLTDVEAFEQNDKSDRGQPISGSSYYREYCAICVEPIRVPQFKVGRDPVCESCEK